MLGQIGCAANQARLTVSSRAVLAEIPAHREGPNGIGGNSPMISRARARAQRARGAADRVV
jgi:hypothetical protein